MIDGDVIRVPGIPSLIAGYNKRQDPREEQLINAREALKQVKKDLPKEPPQKDSYS